MIVWVIVRFILLAAFWLVVGVLGLVLLVVLLALFTPVGYRARGGGGVGFAWRVDAWFGLVSFGNVGGEAAFRVAGLRVRRRRGKAATDKTVEAAVEESGGIDGGSVKRVRVKKTQSTKGASEKKVEGLPFAERFKGGLDRAKGLYERFAAIEGKRRILGKLGRTLKATLKGMGLKRLKLAGVVGFDDPAATAWAMAAGAWAGSVLGGERFTIDLDGDFEAERVDFNCDVAGRFCGWFLLKPWIGFALYPPVFRIIRLVLFNKKGEKNGRSKKRGVGGKDAERAVRQGA